MRFEECTPIQAKCIPQILEGEDILGIAQTGTGKTAAYLLPILSLLDDGCYAPGTRGDKERMAEMPVAEDGVHEFPHEAINCVIMSPTRELAQQIDQAMQGFGYYLDNISSIPVYGGNDGNRFDAEVKAMKRGAGLIIATPGRLISHLQIGNLDLSKCSFFILDEADRMLDMGFSEDILKIAKELPPTCQNIMFSATMPEKIEELAKTILKRPVEVKIAVSKPAEKIKQSAYVCYEPQKLRIIDSIFKQGDLERVIIFSGKKTKVKDITSKLRKMKINCGAMHSDLTQAERDDIMYRFKAGQINVLVATDIVARGIDIDDIYMVINYDVPHDAEDYVHRIGRTARAQRDGRAITFVNEEDIYYFKQIERFLEYEVLKNEMPEGLDKGPDYAAGGNRKPSRGGNKTGNRKGRGRGRKKPSGNRGDSKKSGNKRQNAKPQGVNEGTLQQARKEDTKPQSNKSNKPHNRRKKVSDKEQQ